MIPASYRLEGPPAAPLLVLANSLGTTADLWAPQMPTLTARFRVVRFEHRGHGGTPSPSGPYTVADLGGDIVDLLDHLGEQRASFAGISLGGVLALWMGVHHPDRVDRLVLACTGAHLPSRESWTERAATVRAHGVGGMRDALLGRWFPSGWLTDHRDIEDLATKMLSLADAEGYAGCCEALAEMDQREDLAIVRAPTLVISGADDPVTPPAAGLELATGIADSGLVVLPRASHLANLAAPEVFTSAMVDHLAGGTVVERGDRMRRSVLGDAHVDAAATPGSAFGASFTDLITRYAWGDIWTRPGLDLPTRSAITLAMLTALGRHDELPMHLRAARRNGLSDIQIGEILLQAAVYAGVPVARGAFALATEVLDESESR